MKILAVDYGDSRTGLAISDPSELLATPLKPQIEEKSMVKVAAKICEAAQTNRAQKIVVGLPRNMDGTEGARAQKSRKLAAIVEQQSGLPVRMWDERRPPSPPPASCGTTAPLAKSAKPSWMQSAPR